MYTVYTPLTIAKWRFVKLNNKGRGNMLPLMECKEKTLVKWG